MENEDVYHTAKPVQEDFPMYRGLMVFQGDTAKMKDQADLPLNPKLEGYTAIRPGDVIAPNARDAADIRRVLSDDRAVMYFSN